MDRFILVGVGGAIGSIARYLISGWVQGWTNSATYPYGTLAVNVLGCFIIGILSYLGDVRGVLNPEMRLLLMVGFLGGLTTFSTFSNESMAMVRDSEYGLALLNVGAQIVLGFGAVYLGRLLAGFIWR